MHFRQSFVELVWLVLGALLIVLNSGPGVEASICPSYYPFYSCPRPGDLAEDIICCQRNSRYTCCTQEYIEGWGIGLIVIGSLFFITLLVTTICLCCRKRRRRQDYTRFQDDFTGQQQPGVIVVPGPAPPGYSYNTMAYPPSNVSLPPPPAYDAPATSTDPAKSTEQEQSNGEATSEHQENVV